MSPSNPSRWNEYILMIIAHFETRSYTYISYYCTQAHVLTEVSSRLSVLSGVGTAMILTQESFEALEDNYRQNNRILEM